MRNRNPVSLRNRVSRSLPENETNSNEQSVNEKEKHQDTKKTEQ
jgi:hypothetical protein